MLLSMATIPTALTVKGVQISCNGDMKVLGKAKYIPVNVSIYDRVILADKSKASEMVGVAVRVHKLSPDPAWKDRIGAGMYDNVEVTRLFRCMDPKAWDFILAPFAWDLSVGSVVMVRDDQQDITPQQVEALCYYISSEDMMDKISDALEHQNLTGSFTEIDKLLALYTPEKFREFFVDFKAKKVADDASWATEVSPV